MSTSHRIPCGDGDEYDAFTGWHKVLARYAKAGVRKRNKRTYNRRQRRHLKRDHDA